MFVNYQQQLATRELILLNYNETHRRNTILLERSTDDSDLIIENGSNEEKDYQEEKMAIIMRGLRITGSLLPAVFALPEISVQKTWKSCGEPSNNTSLLKKIKKRFQRNEDTTSQFIAYRYPKTIDIHYLRSIAIQVLSNFRPS